MTDLVDAGRWTLVGVLEDAANTLSLEPTPTREELDRMAHDVAMAFDALKGALREEGLVLAGHLR